MDLQSSGIREKFAPSHSHTIEARLYFSCSIKHYLAHVLNKLNGDILWKCCYMKSVTLTCNYPVRKKFTPSHSHTIEARLYCFLFNKHYLEHVLNRLSGDVLWRHTLKLFYAQLWRQNIGYLTNVMPRSHLHLKPVPYEPRKEIFAKWSGMWLLSQKNRVNNSLHLWSEGNFIRWGVNFTRF